MTIKITFPNKEPLKKKKWEDERSNYNESEFFRELKNGINNTPKNTSPPKPKTCAELTRDINDLYSEINNLKSQINNLFEELEYHSHSNLSKDRYHAGFTRDYGNRW